MFEDVTSTYFFPYYIHNFVFSDKKIKLQKFCPCGFLGPQSVITFGDFTAGMNFDS